MKSLEIFNLECTRLLHENNLLIPLIKSELINTTINNVQIEEPKVKSKLEIFYKKQKLNNEEDKKLWMQENNFTEQKLINKLTYEERLDIYCKTNYDHQIEARFLTRKKDLDIVIYSLIRVRDANLASELYFRASEREADFGDLATTYSVGIERKSRGIVGPTPLSKPHPRLAEVLKASKPGEIQLPFQIGKGHAIVRLETLDNAQLDPTMRRHMGRELFNEWIDTQIDDLKNNLLGLDIKKEIVGVPL